MKFRLLNQKFSWREMRKLWPPLFGAFFSPKKIWNLLGVKLAYLMRHPSPGSMPSILMVESSSYCDMNCLMCPVIMEGTRRQKGNMPFTGFKKLMDEIGDTTMAICFWNFGEPLLNPDIFRMVAEAKGKKIFTAISTNLLSLNAPERQRELLESGLDYLIVSFDGATKETYEKFRSRGNFEPVMNNLKALLALKKELRKARPFINLQFVIMRDNEAEVGQIRRLAQELGVDKLSLKKFTYIGEDTGGFLPKNKDYVLEKYKSGTYMEKCLRPWESVVISWNGDVLPCCGDLKFNFRFGNVFGDKTFRQVWGSRQYAAFREKVLDDINSIKMCQGCPSTDFTTDMFVQ